MLAVLMSAMPFKLDKVDQISIFDKEFSMKKIAEFSKI